MKLAVIPARGGSKRIPQKNIKSFCGKPIIAWSIEAAIKSKCFDKVIVSTDDDEIAKIALEYGAEVPFSRPSELSNDYSGIVQVMQHAINWYNERNATFESVCCIFATAPFISIDDIRHCSELLESNNSDYVFPVTTFNYPIKRALKINNDGYVEMFNPEHYNTRSQDLEEVYHDAGQFYWGSSNAWMNETPIFSPNSSPFVIPRYRVLDIDTPEDWIQAELMFRIQNCFF